MKIAVIGGTGLVGSQVVKVLNSCGNEAVPHSLSSGVDLWPRRHPVDRGRRTGARPGLLSRQGEFIPAVLSLTADERTVRLPGTLVQPIASADIALAVASGDALIAKDGAVIATTTYREWLAP